MRTGVRLRRLAARWFDEGAMARYVDPVLADLQSEYEEAVHGGHTWRSRRIWIAGHVAFLKVVAWYGLTRGTHASIATGEERRAVSRALVSYILLTIVATAVVVAGSVATFIRADYPQATRLTVLLIPQALAVTVPFALMCGILWGLGEASASRRPRALLLIVAFTSSLVMFGMLAWVIPTANQAFRVAVFTAAAGPGTRMGELTPAKGLRELTFTELRQILEPPPLDRFVSEDARRWAFSMPVDLHIVERQYYGRWAVAWSPLVLAVFALALTRRLRHNRLLLGVSGVAAIVAYFGISYYTSGIAASYAPAIAVAWVPNTAFLFASIVLYRDTSVAGSR